MSAPPRTLVAVATYNEIENLPRLVDEVFQFLPQADVLVIDDNSPDGTGEWCDERAAAEPRLKCLHREGKLGLGSATFAGMKHAVEHGYDLLFTLDADFSHPPRYLPDLLAAHAEDDPPSVVIGSRYTSGGGVEGWPLHRRLMSKAVNLYARLMLGLAVRDCSGAFRCYRTEVLRRLDFDSFKSSGYSYLEEILWRLKRQGATFVEVPFVFVDREFGQTKINLREAISAIWIIFRLGLRNWFA